MRILLLFVSLGMLCTPSFAGTWSGYLVDAKCYAIDQRNVNPNDTMTATDRDTALEARLCSPNAKATSFVLMSEGGENLKLDAAGNTKAAALVQKNLKKSKLWVTVDGEREKDSLHVDSISPGT